MAWPWLVRQREIGLVRWGLGGLRWGSLLFLSGELVGQGLRHRVSLDQGAVRVEGLGPLIGCGIQRERESESQAGRPLSQIEARRVEGDTKSGSGRRSIWR